MDHLSPERNIVQNNTTGDNVFSQNGNVYIDRSVHISFSGKECEQIRSLLGNNNDNYVRELEEENKKLLEDNKRLTDMVLELQRQLIECLSSGNLFEK
ncbi:MULTISPECIES: hypothetical protein [Butyricimonas]|uniref:hypothetical protein n=1 Tax=Butyricimonas TaxID=574697 RepID=UPI0007FB27E8|nr:MULTISPECIES: hypothetical protein [Butyricimonas]